MIHLEAPTLSGRSWCVLSDCERYRYALGRQWDGERAELCVVMLNPSTADHTTNDATIRTLLRLAPAWGFGGFRVCNLFALRATSPKELKAHPYPVAPGNEGNYILGSPATDPFGIARKLFWEILQNIPDSPLTTPGETGILIV